MDSVVLFVLVVGVFLVGLAIFAVMLFLFSRKARKHFEDTNGRLSEVSFYLNEFAKSAAKLREKSFLKATAAFTEKKLVNAAREIEEEREIQKERSERARLVAVRLKPRRKEKSD
jgi:hypothetical protein